MALIDQDIKYKVVTAGASLLAGYAVKAALNQSWKIVAKSDPPQNPDSADTTWKEAIAWTLVSSVVLGMAGLLARRAAAALVHKPHFGGEEPLV